MTDTLYTQNLETFRSSLAGSPKRAYQIYGLSLLYSLNPEDVTREKYRLGVKPKSPHDFYNLGALASAEGRHQDALELYNRAEEAGGGFPELYYNLGLTYENLKQKAKAIAAYQTFAELAKKSESEELKNEVRKVKAHVRQLKG